MMPDREEQDSRTGFHRHEVSAGGVVYRMQDSVIEVALASRRTRAGNLVWGLPKGRIDEGETVDQAAVREVREETGLMAAVEASLGEISYFYTWDGAGVSKVVHFFLMRVIGGDIGDHDHEMEEVRWFALPAAIETAAYESERDVVSRAAAALGS